MEFMSITHTAYSVSDMQASLDFYVGKLGFKHAFSILNDEGKPCTEYLMVAPGQFVELFYGKGGFEGASSYNHLCLRVKDCIAAAKELEQSGITLDAQPMMGADTNYQCWIHDPDGNRIEIMQIAPTSPQAKFD